jgi:hypothetical protein
MFSSSSPAHRFLCPSLCELLGFVVRLKSPPENCRIRNDGKQPCFGAFLLLLLGLITMARIVGEDEETAAQGI